MEYLSGKKIKKLNLYEPKSTAYHGPSAQWEKRNKQLAKEGWTEYKDGKPVKKKTSKPKRKSTKSGINLSKGISASVRKGQRWARRSGRKGPLLQP